MKTICRHSVTGVIRPSGREKKDKTVGLDDAVGGNWPDMSSIEGNRMDKLKELEELKSNLEDMQRFHGPALEREPSIAHPLDQAIQEARRRYNCVNEAELRTK